MGIGLYCFLLSKFHVVYVLVFLICFKTLQIMSKFIQELQFQIDKSIESLLKIQYN